MKKPTFIMNFLKWKVEIIIFAMLIYTTFFFQQIENLLKIFTGYSKTFVQWNQLYELVFQHLLIVLISSGGALIFAGGLAVIAHIKKWEGLKEIMVKIGDLGETFPTVALIALAVPFMGYGMKPVILALFIYGILPIIYCTTQGLSMVSDKIVEAADGVGMTTYEKFLKVELPLAMPMILAGVRTSVIINISAATVGAAVGAGGLGMPIVSGIRTYDPVLILMGALPVALMAILADTLIRRFEKMGEWKAV